VGTRRMHIIIETDEVTIIRRHCARRTWCLECAREVELIGMDEAGALVGMTQRAVRDCAETRGWHLSDPGDGTQLVCLTSLLKTK